MSRTVAIVPHTHWDREWYSPFQTFRLRLVELLDELLPLMEADDSYRHFMLDGQMAMVDDYLAVRPEAEPAIRRLAAAGRLAMGPWYVLMDEFLVSGETIVRDLQLGLDRATAFGGAMQVGYLPDMFGHVAQMPQILRLAGFEHAVVWRGVPSTVTGTAFAWRAPDGSEVRAEYLPFGYGNGASVPDDAKGLLRRVSALVDELGPRLGADEPLLWMNGTDHQRPQPWLGRVVAEANELQDDVELRVVPLAEHLAARAAEGSAGVLPVVAGELRSGARANLLMGVASNRVDVKQAAALAERALERRAEPLSALFLPPSQWPQALLDEAWVGVVRNAAHDSVCACSVDEVVDAVLHRYAEARQIGDGLARRALEMVAATVGTDGPVVVNPSARARAGIVELTVAGDEPVEGTQVLRVQHGVLSDATVPGRGLGSLIGRVRSQQIGERTFVNEVTITPGDEGVDVVLHADSRMRANLVVEDVKQELAVLAAARPDDPFRVRIVQPPSQRVLARVDEVAGFGWQAWSPSPLTVEPVVAEGAGVSNGIVSVEVSPHDGSFALDGLPGFDVLVDGGDHGDTYNYSPPDHDELVDRPVDVEIDVVESGPLRARLRVRRTYEWPERVDDDARARVGSRTVVVETVLELRAGEDLVRIEATLDNQCRDHRLRSHFPLPEPAGRSLAECAFAVVERGVDAEGGPTERGLPTFPSRRFVTAGGLTVLHEGLLEYELVDVDGDGLAHGLALTLLRATGMLSRVEMAYRPLPAGPPLRTEGSQVLGRRTLRYAISTSGRDPYAMVDDVFLPLEVTRAAGTGDGPTSGTALTVEGAEVSAVRRRGGLVEVRVFNPSPVPTTVLIDGRGGWLVDLRGRALGPFDGSFELGPHAIATARLRD